MKESEEIMARFETQISHAPGIEGLQAAIDRNFRDYVDALFQEAVLGDLDGHPGFLGILNAPGVGIKTEAREQ